MSKYFSFVLDTNKKSTYYFQALLQSLPAETAVISGSTRFYHRTMLDVGASTRSGFEKLALGGVSECMEGCP